MEAFERPGYNERPLNASVFFGFAYLFAAEFTDLHLILPCQPAYHFPCDEETRDWGNERDAAWHGALRGDFCAGFQRLQRFFPGVQDFQRSDAPFFQFPAHDFAERTDRCFR